MLAEKLHVMIDFNMKPPRIFATILAAIVLLPSIAAAQFDVPGRGRVESAADVSKVRLVADRDEVGPGETFNLVLIFEMSPKWHIYWKNPGEGAAAPDIRLQAPEGFEPGEARWPRPKIEKSAVGDLYCYEGRVALFLPITAPERISDGPAEFVVDLGYAVCSEEKCYFGRGKWTAKVNMRFGRNDGEARDDNAIKRHRQLLPTPVKDADDATAELIGAGENRQLVITGPAGEHKSATFFPHRSPGVRYGKAEMTFEEGRFTARVPLTINPRNFTKGKPRVGGLVALGSNPEDPSFEASLPLEPHDRAAAD